MVVEDSEIFGRARAAQAIYFHQIKPAIEQQNYTVAKLAASSCYTLLAHERVAVQVEATVSMGASLIDGFAQLETLLGNDLSITIQAAEKDRAIRSCTQSLENCFSIALKPLE